MDLDEIYRYLHVSVAHSVVVDVREFSEAPGYVRTITIHCGFGVTIEFEWFERYVEGDMEGGVLKYVGKYESIEDAVKDLEGYLGTSVRVWRNYTHDPYDMTYMVSKDDGAAGMAYFDRLVRERRMPLPSRGGFRLADAYWRHIELYGEFRPDKLYDDSESSGEEEDGAS